jgi:hypothetical protein
VKSSPRSAVEFFIHKVIRRPGALPFGRQVARSSYSVRGACNHAALIEGFLRAGNMATSSGTTGENSTDPAVRCHVIRGRAHVVWLGHARVVRNERRLEQESPVPAIASLASFLLVGSTFRANWLRGTVATIRSGATLSHDPVANEGGGGEQQRAA